MSPIEDMNDDELIDLLECIDYEIRLRTVEEALAHALGKKYDMRKPRKKLVNDS